MTFQKPLVVELLKKSHDRAAFCCGKQPLDDYLKTDQGRNFVRISLFPRYDVVPGVLMGR